MGDGYVQLNKKNNNGVVTIELCIFYQAAICIHCLEMKESCEDNWDIYLQLILSQTHLYMRLLATPITTLLNQ